MSKSDLQFEYNKRQGQISELRKDLREARRELDDLYDWYERDREDRPGAYNAAGTEPSGLHDIPIQMSHIESRISELSDEADTIERVLGARRV